MWHLWTNIFSQIVRFYILRELQTYLIHVVVIFKPYYLNKLQVYKYMHRYAGTILVCSELYIWSHMLYLRQLKLFAIKNNVHHPWSVDLFFLLSFQLVWSRTALQPFCTTILSYTLQLGCQVLINTWVKWSTWGWNTFPDETTSKQRCPSVLRRETWYFSEIWCVERQIGAWMLMLKNPK